MNKHFHNILALMDAAENVPDGITFTKERDILIDSELPLCPSFIESLTNYCNAHDLRHSGANSPSPYFLIINPKNE
jgi:hypothetical protein